MEDQSLALLEADSMQIHASENVSDKSSAAATSAPAHCRRNVTGNVPRNSQVQLLIAPACQHQLVGRKIALFDHKHWTSEPSSPRARSRTSGSTVGAHQYVSEYAAQFLARLQPGSNMVAEVATSHPWETDSENYGPGFSVT